MTIRSVALVSPYALSVPGGAQSQVLAMSRELASREIAVLVVTPDQSDATHYDTPAIVRHFGALAKVPANGSRAPVTLSLRAARRAADAVEDFRPDVIHLHEPFAPVMGWPLLRRHRYPTVGTFHRSGTGPAYTVARPLLARLRSGLDVAVAVSDAAATTIAAGAGVTTEVLFNGFETDRFAEPPRETTAPPTVLFVGRLEERKGVRTVLDAARLRPAWRWVILGDGPLAPDVRRARDDGFVSWLGAVDDATKRTWLRRASVAVAPSTHGESFGLVVLEPMAASTAVVASDIDGYREAAAGHATLFHPGDPDALAAAVDVALTATPDALAAARAHAEHWSMASLVDAYLGRYELARGHYAATGSFGS